ncbi:MAG: hypothetical protein UW97_C0002G0004 [Parcubacteria group bacterium GW2011_GWA2_45_15]|nr:MAG: hypothetical protein UW97_C0002G0004 [Parcubacteria group bacterium GW2011_GWA2_45_15]
MGGFSTMDVLYQLSYLGVLVWQNDIILVDNFQ